MLLQGELHGPESVSAELYSGALKLAANRDLIERSFHGTDFLKDVPPAARFYFASYPESFTCIDIR